MSYRTPENVYFDSGILIGAVIAGSRHSTAASDFCEQIALAGSTIFFSQIARYELAHLAWCLASPADRRELPTDIIQTYGLDHWDTNMLVRHRWLDLINADLATLLSLFREVYEIPIRARHWASAIDIMSYYNLRSYDALHLATARELKIRDFATCDRHFESVDNLDLILVRD